MLYTPLLYSQWLADLGLFGGVSYYMGDLNPRKPFLSPRPAAGVLYRWNMNNRMALRVHYMQGTVTASDSWSGANPSRNLNFTSSVGEVGVQFEVNFYEYFIGSKMHWWTPYIFGGISGFSFKPKGVVNGQTVELKPLGTEGQGSGRDPYSLFAYSIPFGIGMKVSVNKLIGIGAEWGMRKTSTDYLDDVSTTYYLNLAGKDINQATPEELASDPTLSHNAGMQRGNSKDKDWYSFAGVTLVVKIRMLSKERCLDHQRQGY